VQKLYATNYIPVPSPLEEDRVNFSEKESGENDALIDHCREKEAKTRTQGKKGINITSLLESPDSYF